MSALKVDSLPKGWKIVRVKEIADSIQYGHTASAIFRKAGPRFLRITDIQNGQVDWDSVPSCDIPEKDIAKYRLTKGDLVFARTGATTGKSFLIHDCPEAIFASYLIRVRVSITLDSGYLAAFFQSPDYWQQIEKGKRGIGQPNVNGKVLGEVQFPLPPLDEQRRIVAEIEKQFTRLDAGVAALQRVQLKLKRYRASVLKSACEGRLVPTESELARAEGRDYESAKVLLQRILTERREKWNGRGKYKEPAAPDIADLPELPEGWVWATTTQVLYEVKDGTHDTPKYHEAGIPFITQKHIKPTGLVFENYKLISLDDHEQFYKRSNPERGDILVSMIGVNRGESCIVTMDEIFSIKNVGLFKPYHEFTNVVFIQFYLSSRLGQTLILRNSKGGAQPFIGLTELRGWSIPLPPLAEQERIAAEVERRLSVVDELEATITANLQRATRLRQAILQRAFNGEVCS